MKEPVKAVEDVTAISDSESDSENDNIRDVKQYKSMLLRDFVASYSHLFPQRKPQKG